MHQDDELTFAKAGVDGYHYGLIKIAGRTTIIGMANGDWRVTRTEWDGLQALLRPHCTFSV